MEGVNVRKKPSMRDSEPSTVAKEGSEPQRDKWPQVERYTSKTAIKSTRELAVNYFRENGPNRRS